MNCNLKKTLAFERLKNVVNSLKNASSDGILNKCEENVLLNGERVKNTLDELIGGLNGIAHVILDENDQLFSSLLLQEAKASANCIKKIQNLIQNESNGKQKPIILITTNQNKSFMVIVILTNEFQSIDSAKSFPLV